MFQRKLTENQTTHFMVSNVLPKIMPLLK